MVNRTITVHFCGKPIKHNPSSVYLGVTLDRTVIYKQHLKKIAAKLRTKTFLISKLAGIILECLNPSSTSSTHIEQPNLTSYVFRGRILFAYLRKEHPLQTTQQILRKPCEFAQAQSSPRKYSACLYLPKSNPSHTQTKCHVEDRRVTF